MGYGTVFRFPLTQPNPLTIAMTGGTVMLSWPTNAAITLQACTDLSNRAWVPPSPGPAVNGRYQFSEPMEKSGSARFYRLIPNRRLNYTERQKQLWGWRRDAARTRRGGRLRYN